MELILNDSREFVLLSLAAEAAGVFWVLAEVAIFFVLIRLREFTDSRFHAQTSLIKWFVLTCAGILVIFLTTQLRYLLFPPIHTYADPTTAAPMVLYSHTLTLRQLQVVIWAGYVTAWVLLEAAIVYQGVKVYRSFIHALENA